MNEKLKLKMATAARAWAVNPTIKNRERLQALMSCAAAELEKQGKRRDELGFGNLVYHHAEIRELLESVAKERDLVAF